MKLLINVALTCTRESKRTSPRKTQTSFLELPYYTIQLALFRGTNSLPWKALCLVSFSITAVKRKESQVKVKRRVKLRRNIIFESVLIMFVKNYQNQSVFDVITGCQIQHIFWDTGYVSIQNSLHCSILSHSAFPFSALTLLVGRQEGHPACKKLDVDLLVVMIWLELCTTYSSSCHHHFHNHLLQ